MTGIALLSSTAPFYAQVKKNSLYEFTSQGNPVITHKFTADPAAIVENDTLWLFTGHDFEGGQNGYTMKDWLVFSTTENLRLAIFQILEWVQTLPI